ncbi:hypothetical protein A2865_04040 [Candidatus Woesebacteria bacterium RIFCSPHIGHO2_01_FULL_39_17]|uniref:Uncharacterized protein n=3 Tax=Candidatus Woeseibacteriota TaxID=1752722 RepID=A0A0G0RJ63_9BACT|nr:MAG: hypothetical protein US72_C0012G0004 [Microgenomates group bacterium GW2011_GWC1_38_12]KKQ93495.1 MAG: hypothetical protein UT19_C0011G0040 [Candidatus Woesebacteria bacterium GW2011_GWB1_39_10b]KKR13657.1 MAG: hypothetical protein UT40_C0012G0023 [Candidatus Woesebacteria bacterium GW2011_GWA1_39_21b]OGM23278.1 MAG: hypothetical protein A2865_04040 [Candidatus Woesebacteria bacterium RIFCSPHIGHO2_01_FULL_39_17]OGM65706.1 MAG: hypothetical protein A3A52_05260 [Candidatus Woesebacteria b
MEDTQVLPAQEKVPEEKELGAGKKVLIALAGILLIVGVGAGSYFWGSKGKSQGTSNLSPTSSEEILTPTPTPTSEPSPEATAGKGKPTFTPTPTLTPTPTVKQKILSSSTSLDGFRSSNGGGNAGLEIRAGRNVNLVTRGFVSFDLGDIPSGAKIQEATLRLYQAKIIGNPYGVGGSLKVDHLTYGDALDNLDYGIAALSSSFITLTSNNSLEWKDAIVTDQVKDDLANGRSRSQFRIHFQIENTGGDVTGDFAYFEAAENNMGTGNTPQLVVKYY